MYGSLDTSFAEKRSLYMAQVVGRHNRYPHNIRRHNELAAT
jgi:hypothetical protein